MEKEQTIKCTVYDCKHCNCDCNCCNLDEIKVCNCKEEDEKEATMCDNFTKRKKEK